jgi:hypothetical protein
MDIGVGKATIFNLEKNEQHKCIRHLDLSPAMLMNLIRNRLENSFAPVHESSVIRSDTLVFIDPSISIMHSIQLDHELFGSIASKSDRRSYVLIHSNQQSARLQNSVRRDMAATLSHRSNPFVENEAILHPAQVRSYIKVRFQSTNSKNTIMDTIAHPNLLMNRVAHFALVDFYKPHNMRRSWVFSNVAEIWSNVFQQFPGGNDSTNLIGIEYLAGKFVPGIFTEKFPLVKNKWNRTDKNCTYGRDRHCESLPMAVLRLPLRNVL